MGTHGAAPAGLPLSVAAEVECYNPSLRMPKPTPSSADVTQLLLAWSQGDEQALDQLIPIVYRELRSLARRYLERERPGHTLQATALVNEAYMRLADINRMQWQNRAHFFAISAQTMRRILVEHARRRNQLKRGNGAIPVELDQVPDMLQTRSNVDLVIIDQALNALSEVNDRHARIIELRFFGGLSVEESAEVLKVSTDTVTRDWKAAKAWLLRYLSAPPTEEPGAKP
ncbi:MAG TPA: sigma-70 family RNA polymerase sigma factor [Terriglobia bacterium]|nr:sigma-70 family RNA polymerase sigma factor [Terriglobia bacterium]